MSDPHSAGLVSGYVVALAGWLGASRLLPGLWPGPGPDGGVGERPWRGLAWFALAVVAVIAVGQAYQADLLLPRAGPTAPTLGRAALEAINQLLIFGPVVLLLAWRGRPFRDHAWLPGDRVPVRLAVGVVLAALAGTAFLVVRGDPARAGDLAAFVASPHRVHVAVQVFLEDVTIAAAFVRVAAVTRHPRATAVAVGVAFAAGHVPAMLAGDASLIDLLPLVRDAALATGVLLVLRRSADVWWFGCVHLVLDLTQYFPRG